MSGGVKVRLAGEAAVGGWLREAAVSDLAVSASMLEAERFEAIYVPESVERRVPLAELGRVPLDGCRPVRAFPSYRGQRNFPGWYWSATMGRRIGFESWVERDHLIALDFDPSVQAVASQPFWLVWRTPAGKVRRHAPDFFVRGLGSDVLVVDSRPLDRIEDRDEEAFSATQRACDQLGWRYAVWGSIGAVLAANHRWVAGYRHPRCYEPVIADRLLKGFEQPRSLISGAEFAGDPLGTLPVLFHLIWRHELVVDLSVVLSDRSVVGLGGGRG